MKGVCRLGDFHTGHDCFAPTPCNKASPNVFVNGKGVCRLGDSFLPHACPKPHPVIASSGSGSVFVNDLPVVRVGDSTFCGAKVMTGSANVLVGG